MEPTEQSTELIFEKHIKITNNLMTLSDFFIVILRANNFGFQVQQSGARALRRLNNLMT